MMTMLMSSFVASAAVSRPTSWPYSCEAGQYVQDMPADLSGKTILVTGANGRLGYPLTEALARAGAATVVVGSRTVEKAEATRGKIQQAVAHPITVDTMVADLSSFSSVQAGAAGVLSRHRSIDILIHMAGTGGRNNLTADGFVETVEINHLSSVLLTKLLLPALKQSTSPRVVYVGSANLFDPVQWTTSSIISQTEEWIKNSLPETSFDYYGLSKLLLANYAVEEARRRPNLTVFTVNPGWGRVDADNKTNPIYKEGCAELVLFRPCPQFPAQAVTSTFFAATQQGIEEASGSLIDFATNLTGGDDFVQYGQSCIPRPLPPGGINSHQAEWYDAVNDILAKEVVVV